MINMPFSRSVLMSDKKWKDTYVTLYRNR